MIVSLPFVVLDEGASWIFAYAKKIMIVNGMGGIVPYGFMYVRTLLLPELMTILLLLLLMYWVRRLVGINSIELTWFSIGGYELLFLPVMLGAFVLIFPLTQSVRFLFADFPTYSFSHYCRFLVSTFTWRFYFLFLFPILLIGYTTLNLSLILDYLKPISPPPLE